MSVERVVCKALAENTPKFVNKFLNGQEAHGSCIIFFFFKVNFKVKSSLYPLIKMIDRLIEQCVPQRNNRTCI